MKDQDLHEYLKANSSESNINDICMLYKKSDGYVFLGIHDNQIGVGHLNIPLSMINNPDILANVKNEIYNNIVSTSKSNLYNVYDENVAYRF